MEGDAFFGAEVYLDDKGAGAKDVAPDGQELGEAQEFTGCMAKSPT